MMVKYSAVLLVSLFSLYLLYAVVCFLLRPVLFALKYLAAFFSVAMIALFFFMLFRSVEDRLGDALRLDQTLEMLGKVDIASMLTKCVYTLYYRLPDMLTAISKWCGDRLFTHATAV